MAQAVNMDKHIFEGWTVKNFIEELEPLVDMIMNGNAMTEPFKTKKGNVSLDKGKSALLQKSNYRCK